jgi:hypothetical protein
MAPGAKSAREAAFRRFSTKPAAGLAYLINMLHSRQTAWKVLEQKMSKSSIAACSVFSAGRQVETRVPDHKSLVFWARKEPDESSAEFWSFTWIVLSGAVEVGDHEQRHNKEENAAARSDKALHPSFELRRNSKDAFQPLQDEASWGCNLRRMSSEMHRELCPLLEANLGWYGFREIDA